MYEKRQLYFPTKIASLQKNNSINKKKSFPNSEPHAVDTIFLHINLHFLVNRRFRLVLPITVLQWEASSNIGESFSLSSHSPHRNVSTGSAIHLCNWTAQQSIKDQAEASHSGHGNAFYFKKLLWQLFLVMQGSHKARLTPWTHQRAATLTLAQAIQPAVSFFLPCEHSGCIWQCCLPLMFLVMLAPILKICFILELQASLLPTLKRIFAKF